MVPKVLSLVTTNKMGLPCYRALNQTPRNRLLPQSQVSHQSLPLGFAMASARLPLRQAPAGNRVNVHHPLPPPSTSQLQSLSTSPRLCCPISSGHHLVPMKLTIRGIHPGHSSSSSSLHFPARSLPHLSCLPIDLWLVLSLLSLSTEALPRRSHSHPNFYPFLNIKNIQTSTRTSLYTDSP